MSHRWPGIYLCFYCDELYSEPISPYTECAHDVMHHSCPRFEEYTSRFFSKLRKVGL